MDDYIDITEPLAAIERQIADVERGFTHEVRVVAVTKGFGQWAIEAAVSAGCPAIGENYAQELETKRDVIERLAPEVHFVGRLQTNKVRLVADLVDVWASLDRTSLVDEVARRAPAARVLIQVDTTGDPAKGGCGVADVAALVARAREAGLVVDGLMTVGPTGEPAESARTGFRQVRNLVDDLGLEVCSMGMSGDLAIAVREGSTEVRIGTALFGSRPLRR